MHSMLRYEVGIEMVVRGGFCGGATGGSVGGAVRVPCVGGVVPFGLGTSFSCWHDRCSIVFF